MWNIKATVPDDNITIVRYSDNVGRDNAYGYFQITVESLELTCLYAMEKMSLPTLLLHFVHWLPCSLDYFIAH